MLIALAAPLAYSAAIGLPAHSDTLTDSMALNIASHLYYRSHNLVARDKGIFAEAPVVVDQVNIAVAHPTVRDLDLDFICKQVARIELVRKQMRTGSMYSKTMYFTHQESIPFLRRTSTSSLTV
jgi:hypothetical protein